MNFIGYRTLKTVIGTVTAMYLAMHFGLKYATAAGIIAILSIQSTRKQSLRFAGKMVGAFLLALLTASLLFRLAGYTPLVFGLFLLIFIPLSVRLKVQEGIVVSSVLISQLLVEQSIAWPLIFNQLALMGIGVTIALLLNLYMPNFEHKIRREQDAIEKTMQEILVDMSGALRNQVVSIKEEELFTQLERRLKKGREIAFKNYNNSFYSSNSDYTQYMDIRLQQLHCLQSMRKHFDRLFITYKQTLLIADFTLQVAQTFRVHAAADQQLANLSELRQSFTTMDLPKDRDEFENRGMLYQFLNDMEEFLVLESIIK